MNYDDLYEKDYIKYVPDEACAPTFEDEFYCDVQFYENERHANGYAEEQFYYESVYELIRSIYRGLKRQGYPLNQGLIKQCIKKQDLETFFDAIHFMFKATGKIHWIEFRQFDEDEIAELQRNSDNFIYCHECMYRDDCDYAEHDEDGEKAGCVLGEIDYENEDN